MDAGPTQGSYDEDSGERQTHHAGGRSSGSWWPTRVGFKETSE